jgi:hypothetical protein
MRRGLRECTLRQHWLSDMGDKMFKRKKNKRFKYYLGCLVIIIASGVSVANAQSDPFIGANLNLDIIQGNTLVGLGFHVGDYSLLGGAGLRGNFAFGLSPSGYFEFGGDVLAPLSSGATTPYLGGGAGMLVSGGTLFNIHALGGLEFRAGYNFGIFVEAAPTFYFQGGGNAFGFAIKFGGNYHF